nr:unnamed protein product [Callosobruchus analis]
MYAATNAREAEKRIKNLWLRGYDAIRDPQQVESRQSSFYRSKQNISRVNQNQQQQQQPTK